MSRRREITEALPGLALILGAAVVQLVGVSTILWWAWQWWHRP